MAEVKWVSSEALKKAKKKYYDKNREHLNDVMSTWRDNNYDKVQEHRKRSYHKHADKRREYRMKIYYYKKEVDRLNAIFLF